MHRCHEKFHCQGIAKSNTVCIFIDASGAPSFVSLQYVLQHIPVLCLWPLSFFPAWCLALILSVLAVEDVIARLIPPQLAASSAQSADQVADHDQASGPAHPALWAPLAQQQQQQPAPCPTPPPTSPNVSAPGHPDGAVQEPSVPFCTMSCSLDDVVQLQATALFGCPSLPARFRAVDGSLRASRRSSTHGPPKQLAQLSGIKNVQPSTTILAGGSHRQSMPTLYSNIVPLQGLVRGHSGSKRLYNSLSDNSRHGASVQHDSRQAACSVYDITAQGYGSGSSTDDLHSDFQQQQQQQRWQQQQQQQRQQQAAPNAPSTGLWTQTSRLARLVSFPVRVTRAYYSYVPLGQQLYLNPQSVSTSIQDPHRPLGTPRIATGNSSSSAAGATAESAPASFPAAISPSSEEQPATALIPDAVSDMVDSVVLQRREQLGRLWMHRMPTYRARFQQIFFGALGQPLPVPLPSLAHQAPQPDGDSSRLGRPIAPQIHVRLAEACAGSLLASHHFKDMLKVSFSLPACQ